MKIRFDITHSFLTLFFIFWAAVNGWAQSTVLDADSQQPFAGFGQYFVAPQEPEKQKETLPSSPSAAEGEAVFKILSITNISGNNPFHTTQPVLNFGGVVVSSVDDLAECIRGGVCQSGKKETTMTCSPSSGISDLASCIESVGCYLKSNATVCRVEPLPSSPDLSYETFFVMNDYRFAKSNVVGTASKSDYKLIIPPSGNTYVWPGGDTVYKIGTGTYTLEVQHKVTGLRYRIEFTVQQLASNDIRLTVNSLVKL